MPRATSAFHNHIALVFDFDLTLAPVRSTRSCGGYGPTPGHFASSEFSPPTSNPMRKLFFIAVCFLWHPTTGTAEHVADQSPTSTVELFNGSDLEGWYPYLRQFGRSDPHGVFSVRDSVLRISGEVDGYLSTRTSWKDYRLVAEFRWGRSNRPDRQGKARDAGLFLHSAGPDGNSFDARGAYKAAIECQIMEGAVGDLLLIKGKDRSGEAIGPRLTTRVAEERDVDGWPFFLPSGQQLELRGWGRVNHLGKSRQWTDTFGFGRSDDAADGRHHWNRIECICAGDCISIFVNGQLVNAARNVFPRSGPILLQSEGSEIFFRKVQLHPLPGASSD